MSDANAWKYKINSDFTSEEPFTLKAMATRDINCDTCFNKKYYPPQTIADVCKFCKEKNMWFYKPDWSDFVGKI